MRAAGLDDLLQDGQKVADRADLLVGDQDVGILEDRPMRSWSVTMYGEM